MTPMATPPLNMAALPAQAILPGLPAAAEGAPPVPGAFMAALAVLVGAISEAEAPTPDSPAPAPMSATDPVPAVPASLMGEPTPAAPVVSTADPSAAAIAVALHLLAAPLTHAPGADADPAQPPLPASAPLVPMANEAATPGATLPASVPPMAPAPSARQALEGRPALSPPAAPGHVAADTASTLALPQPAAAPPASVVPMPLQTAASAPVANAAAPLVVAPAAIVVAVAETDPATAPAPGPRVLRAVLAAQEAGHAARQPTPFTNQPSERAAQPLNDPPPIGATAPAAMATGGQAHAAAAPAPAGPTPGIEAPTSQPAATVQAAPLPPAQLEGGEPAPGARAAARDADAMPRQLTGPITALASLPAAGAPRSVTVALHPIELGRVELTVEKRQDGRLAIGVAAERPETLVLLRADQAALDRALTQAGLPAENRSISFDLAGGGAQQQQGGTSTFGEPRGGRDSPARHGAGTQQADAAPSLPPSGSHATAANARLDISI